MMTLNILLIIMFVHVKYSFLISLQQVFTDGMEEILKHTISSSPNPPGRVCTQVMAMGHHLAEVIEETISML